MRVLLIENSEDKIRKIKQITYEIDARAIIDKAEDLSEAVKHLDVKNYDLVVFDFMMPPLKGSIDQNLGIEILRSIRASKANATTDCIAITEFQDEKNKLEKVFHNNGVLILEYNETNEKWISPLKVFLHRARSKLTCNFIVVCAVDVEREAYQSTNATIGIPKNIGGIDLLPIEYEGLHGYVALLPRMGIVNATAITSILVERFRPDLICMSGICGGIKKATTLGQIIIADPCWEHQVGKFTPTGLKAEIYQISLPEDLRQRLKNIIELDFNSSEIYHGIPKDKLSPKKPTIAPLVSGSAVVASKWKLRKIQKSHRKLAGLEMETFGVLKAVQLANPTITAFSAKSVVDFADKKKDKHCQSEAAIVSARFCLLAISKILNA